ncbi:MAG TPA: hypothetical protein ENI45_00315 [Thermoplasmatales archaeon]|nr:hypothetical protein [Thermoplasmatales archaeon]
MSIEIAAEVQDTFSGVFGAKLYLDDELIDSGFVEHSVNSCWFNCTLYRTQGLWGKHTLRVEAMDSVGYIQSKEIKLCVPNSASTSDSLLPFCSTKHRLRILSILSFLL